QFDGQTRGDRFGRDDVGRARCEVASSGHDETGRVAIRSRSTAMKPRSLPAAVPALKPVGRNQPYPAPSFDKADSYSVRAVAEVVDRAYRAGIARLTAGISPMALAQAYF